MTDTHFKIMFEGQVRHGVDIDTAKDNLARLFKSEPTAVQKLFNGQPVTLKRGLPYEEAELYIKALNEAGVEARIEADPAITLSMNEANSLTKDSTPSPPQDFSPYAPPKSQVGPELTGHSTLKVFSVQGRIGRLRYLAWTMGLCGAGLAAFLITLSVIGMTLVGGGLLAAVLVMAFAVVSTMIGVQRLHDMGWSGWLLLLTIVPFVGSLFPILMMLLPGTKGPNKYGAPPPPNSRAVKVTASLWLLLIPILLIGGIRGGIDSLREEVEIKTNEYEQSLPYDDENQSEDLQQAPSNAEQASEEENDK